MTIKMETLWFMKIKDKINISDSRFCPPHYLPHKLPWGKKVTTENCHIHTTWWRMLHHSPFCRYLKCPNYSFMIKKYKEFKQRGSPEQILGASRLLGGKQK